jgi:hypothetical protein
VRFLEEHRIRVSLDHVAARNFLPDDSEDGEGDSKALVNLESRTVLGGLTLRRSVLSRR